MKKPVLTTILALTMTLPVLAQKQQGHSVMPKSTATKSKNPVSNKTKTPPAQVPQKRSFAPNPAAQTYAGFAVDFHKACSTDMKQADLDQLLHDYSNLTMFSIDVNQKELHYPLEKLRSEPTYAADIQSLLKSTNPYQRTLAYVTLGSSGDSSFNDNLLSAAKTEKLRTNKRWAGIALLFLHDNHTSDLFDFVVENENFGDAHLVPLYLRINKDALKKTAFEKIESNDPKARILAAESLTAAGPDPETDRVIKKALADWDPSIQGYALNTIKVLEIGNLKPFVAPCLDIPALRQAAMDAFANSPIPEDRDYLAAFLPTKGLVPQDILNAYFQSTRTDSLRKWLQLISDRDIPTDYHFTAAQQPQLKSNNVVADVRSAIRRTKNRQILQELPRVLEDRKDDESVDLLISLLSDKDPKVRYWAAHSLRERTSPALVAVLPGLIRNKNLRTVALTDLAINNKVGDLQDVYAPYVQNDLQEDLDWYNTALHYLAVFPRQEDKPLLYAILKSKKDSFAKRSAAEALGQLQDQEAVDLIAASLHDEPSADSNAIAYLNALGKIKGDKAKAILESYKGSQDQSVQELVTKLLTNW
ncbi:MAG: HEAT repeat domain-containing protein [Candidatus Obscuribacterales bacterium]|nr:HEAT repeat domain-containing protein [Candidatus Obscuribacterales bacterium]